MKTKIDPYTDTDDGRLFSLIEQGDEGAFTPMKIGKKQ